jgi:hypothetical protein
MLRSFADANYQQNPAYLNIPTFFYRFFYRFTAVALRTSKRI